MEPEIIPPSHSGAGPQFRRETWVWSNRRGLHRIRVARLGPFGMALLIFGAGLFTALVLILLIGALLLWIPVLALLVVGAVLATFLQRSLRRWR